MLTDRSVRNAAAGMHGDGGGLYLRVSPKGKRVWVHRIRAGGKDQWVTIGTYPQMSLADARRAKDVSRETTMGEALRQYVAKLSVKRPEQVVRLLKPLYEMSLLATRQELVSQLQQKANTSPVMANRMLTRWKDFFNFCEQQGWVPSNPLSIVQRKYVGGREQSRSRVVEWEELADAPLPVLFVLLSGLRPSEAIWALRHKRTSGIPTKTTPHWIPNTPLVRWFLRQGLPLPASHLTWSNYLRRKNVTWRPHDLRRTFATRLNDLGVAPHVVEKMLNHKLQGVMAVYNHAEYRAERIAAQRLWERELLRRRKNAPD